MRFEVTHHTRFRYSRPVVLEPLIVRLQPRADFRQRLLEFSLKIEPPPACLTHTSDLEGNQVTCASFRDSTDRLTLTTSFIAHTDDTNPFDFLLAREAQKLPLRPGADQQRHFDLYAEPRLPSEQVTELSRRIAAEAGFDTLRFVTRLNEWVHRQHDKIVRPVGRAWEPEQTLREARGSCRDLAVLLVEGCRAMNIPSRFVSGYSAAEEQEEGQLHAWAEVYLPGGGWRGFDPSLGLAITERHLAVAAGATPVLAAPTSGLFCGEATSCLEAEIKLSTSLQSPLCVIGNPEITAPHPARST